MPPRRSAPAPASVPVPVPEDQPTPPWADDHSRRYAEDSGEEEHILPNHRPGPSGEPLRVGAHSKRSRQNGASTSFDRHSATFDDDDGSDGGDQDQGKGKRRRVGRACEPCRRRKVACSGQKPCEKCVFHGDNCHYFEVKDRSAYSKRYVESLEARLARLESALNAAISGGLQSAAPIMSGTSYMMADLGPPAPITDMYAPAAEPPESTAAMRATLDSTTTDHGDFSGLRALAEASTEPRNYNPGESRPEERRRSIPSQAQGRLQYDENRNLRYLGPSATVTLLLDAHSSLEPASSSAAGSIGGGGSGSLGWITSSLGINLSKVLPSVESVTFPERDLCDLLVRTFFDCIHPIFPVLDEREFTLRYASLFDNARAGNPDGPRADPLFVATLFAIFACSSRIVHDPRVCPVGSEAKLWGYDGEQRQPRSAGAGASSQPGGGSPAEQRQGSTSSSRNGSAAPPGQQGKEHRPNFALAGIQFFARSQLLILHKSMETRIEQVQTHALLAYYYAASNCAARAWLIIGQALRMSLDLGLHRNLSHLGLSHFELEVRKRVWWCVYVLDRMLSVSLGRPLGIEDASIDQQFPTTEFQPPFQLVSGFASIVRLVRLTSDIAKTNFQRQSALNRRDWPTVARHEKEARDYIQKVEDWFEAVPTHLKTGAHEVGSATALQSCVSFILYRSTLLLLHRSFLQGGLVSASKDVAQRSEEEKNALSECYKTSQTLIKAAPRIAGSLPASPFLLEYAQQVLVAGGYLSLIAWRYRGTDEAERYLFQAQEAALALHGLEPLFPSARSLRRVLESVIAKLRAKSRALQEEAGKGSDQRSEAAAPTMAASLPQRSSTTSSIDPPLTPGTAPFNTESWLDMLHGSTTGGAADTTGAGQPLAPDNGPPSSNAGGGEALNEGLDFQGLEWLESMLGSGRDPTAEGNNNMEDFASAFWG